MVFNQKVKSGLWIAPTKPLKIVILKKLVLLVVKLIALKTLNTIRLKPENITKPFILLLRLFWTFGNFFIKDDRWTTQYLKTIKELNI